MQSVRGEAAGSSGGAKQSVKGELGHGVAVSRSRPDEQAFREHLDRSKLMRSTTSWNGGSNHVSPVSFFLL